MESQSKRRRSLRLPNYDYTLAGCYSLTICSQDRECLFGEIRENGTNCTPLCFYDLSKLMARPIHNRRSASVWHPVRSAQSSAPSSPPALVRPIRLADDRAGLSGKGTTTNVSYAPRRSCSTFADISWRILCDGNWTRRTPPDCGMLNPTDRDFPNPPVVSEASVGAACCAPTLFPFSR